MTANWPWISRSQLDSRNPESTQDSGRSFLYPRTNLDTNSRRSVAQQPGTSFPDQQIRGSISNHFNREVGPACLIWTAMIRNRPRIAIALQIVLRRTTPIPARKARLVQTMSPECGSHSAVFFQNPPAFLIPNLTVYLARCSSFIAPSVSLKHTARACSAARTELRRTQFPGCHDLPEIKGATAGVSPTTGLVSIAE
jgi:hypothetical protein